MVGFLGWIVIGLLAGWIASMVLNRQHGLVVNLIIGLIGACIGGWVNSHFIHFAMFNTFVNDLLVAFAGSVILLLILGFINRPKA